MYVSFEESQLSCPNYYEADSESIKKQATDMESLLSTLPESL